MSKGHLRSVMHKLFDLATLWEYLPLERRNPIEIVAIHFTMAVCESGHGNAVHVAEFATEVGSTSRRGDRY